MNVQRAITARVGSCRHGRMPYAAPGVPGFALVEMMIALLLGLVIVAALGQLYAGARASFALNDALARLNENGRFAVDFLSNDLRMAGYTSCGGPSARLGNSVIGNGNWAYETRGLAGYDGAAGGTPTEFSNADSTKKFRAGTDILIVRRAALDLERTVVLNLVPVSDSVTGIIKLGLLHGFQTGEVLVISNPSCTQASVFQVTGISYRDVANGPEKFDGVTYGTTAGTSPGNCTRALLGTFTCANPGLAENGVFRPGSVVSRFAVHAYYVTSTDPPTLVRQRLSVVGGKASLITEELIRNIENFQVLYGRDTTNDSTRRVDDYVTANLITDWSKVIGVRFAMLMRSHEDNVRSTAVSQSYDLLGTSVTAPADRRIRRSFGAVVALRNSLP